MMRPVGQEPEAIAQPALAGTCPSSRPDGNSSHRPPSPAGSPSRFFLLAPIPYFGYSHRPHLTRPRHTTPRHTTTKPFPSSIGARRPFIPLSSSAACLRLHRFHRVISCFPIPIAPVDPQRSMVSSAAASPLVATAADSASSCVAHLRCCSCRVGCCCCC